MPTGLSPSKRCSANWTDRRSPPIGHANAPKATIKAAHPHDGLPLLRSDGYCQIRNDGRRRLRPIAYRPPNFTQYDEPPHRVRPQVFASCRKFWARFVWLLPASSRKFRNLAYTREVRCEARTPPHFPAENLRQLAVSPVIDTVFAPYCPCVSPLWQDHGAISSARKYPKSGRYRKSLSRLSACGRGFP